MILVGEAPSRGGSNAAPLGGARLARLAPAWDSVPRTNLLRRWPGPDGEGSAFNYRSRTARRRAREIARQNRRVVVCGRRAARCFGLSGREPFFEWTASPLGCQVAIFPHPSGLNRYWNDASNRRRAARFARSTVGFPGRATRVNMDCMVLRYPHSFSGQPELLALSRGMLDCRTKAVTSGGGGQLPLGPRSLASPCSSRGPGGSIA